MISAKMDLKNAFGPRFSFGEDDVHRRNRTKPRATLLGSASPSEDKDATHAKKCSRSRRRVKSVESEDDYPEGYAEEGLIEVADKSRRNNNDTRRFVSGSRNKHINFVEDRVSDINPRDVYLIQVHIAKDDCHLLCIFLLVLTITLGLSKR